MKILVYGHPILREKSQPVENINGELKKIIEQMAELMYKVKGLGLAANQVGIPKRFFILDVAQKEGNPELMVFINPEILEAQGKVTYEEGCLSIPGYYAKIERFSHLWIRAHNLDGNPFEKELSGLSAIVFQHEYDHIEGVLFIDRLSLIKQNLFKRWWKKQKPKELFYDS